jgi:hypothetical protein
MDIIGGIVTGPAVTRLLTGRAGFFVHRPVRRCRYLVHFAWICPLLTIVHVW